MPRIFVLTPLVTALAAAVPSHAARLPDRSECSPIPHVVHLESLDVPGAGLVVTSTAGLSCTPPAVIGNAVTTVRASRGRPRLPRPSRLRRRGRLRHVHRHGRLRHTPHLLLDEPLPGNFCFSPPTLDNAGTYHLRCVAEIHAPATSGGFVWWAQSSTSV